MKQIYNYTIIQYLIINFLIYYKIIKNNNNSFSNYTNTH